ncbi:MAG: AMP-binding protein [Kofleriaceae bacterium]|nr:AMP-binding protein [Kofleriaceae bacterium]
MAISDDAGNAGGNEADRGSGHGSNEQTLGARPTPAAAERSGVNPTKRRKRKVWWAKRIRRFGMAWNNALEIATAGRLTAPYGAPYEVVHEEKVYRLRRYQSKPDAGVPICNAPLLLVPPLMVASEVYDIAPDVSAVANLSRAGIDVWLVDFGAPEREEGGMSRTLDDHVRAVADAIDRVNDLTGHNVHLAGYSQGGMFCYQAAAFKRSARLESIITFGSPVDLHRTVNLGEGTTERLVAGARSLLNVPLAHIDGLPGFFTSTGFKLLSARKEAQQLVDFVRNLHDRQALEKREARRLFLGGEGFVAWPGPAFRKFFDDHIVSNRMASGGFVIDGRTVTLSDITTPTLYFVGDHDEMGRPAAVRGIRRASPKIDELYEIGMRAGHFGLVVGGTAQRHTWPAVAEWIRWREAQGDRPKLAVDVRQYTGIDTFKYTDAILRGDVSTAQALADAVVASARPAAGPRSIRALAVDRLTHRPQADAGSGDDNLYGADDYDDEDDVSDRAGLPVDLELAQQVVRRVATGVIERMASISEDLGSYFDNARWQLPRLNRLRNLTDDTTISLGKSLADQAAKIPDNTFFLWRGRAFTYAEANRRVDAVVRGLIATGVKPGQRVGVMMLSRPSHLSVVAAINRLGAVAVLLSPNTPQDKLSRCLDLGETDVVIVDPESAARVRVAFAGKVMVLGGAGDPALAVAPGQVRTLPAGVVDMEAIDPETVVLPSWYRPDSGRARDLAMVFVTSGKHEASRVMRITNRRWAFSALGAAASCTLTSRDTVYCCLPLHHPSGSLVAVGSALIGGTRLALASQFEPTTFWDEVRRYGVTVVYYAGEMGRNLVDSPSVVGEQNNPVRLFAGSGMRNDVWRRIVERFGVGVLEFYASTEANAVLANASGKKIGSCGRPLPGAPQIAIAAWNFDDDDFVRDGHGFLVPARIDEPGMLVAKLDARGGADIAHIDPKRLLRGAFGPDDVWFVTGDFLRVDVEGDYFFVDRAGQMIATANGPVASTRIEDALYDSGTVALCVALGIGARSATPVAAVTLRSQLSRATGVSTMPADIETLDALTAAALTLPDYARPQRIAIVDNIPLTAGFRPLKRTLSAADFADGPRTFEWDLRVHCYVATG